MGSSSSNQHNKLLSTPQQQLHTLARQQPKLKIGGLQRNSSSQKQMINHNKQRIGNFSASNQRHQGQASGKAKPKKQKQRQEASLVYNLMMQSDVPHLFNRRDRINKQFRSRVLKNANSIPTSTSNNHLRAASMSAKKLTKHSKNN